MKFRKWIGSLLLLSPISAFAWFGSQGVDYSQNAPGSFYCADLAGTSVTTQAGLSATTPALTIYNPSTTKNLVLLDVGLDMTASPAAAAGFMLAYSTGAPTSTTGAAVTPALIGKSTTTALGQCYRIATLPNAPVAFRYLGGTTGAAAIGGVSLTDMTQGKVVIPPGYNVSIQATSAAVIIAHFLWMEQPI